MTWLLLVLLGVGLLMLLWQLFDGDWAFLGVVIFIVILFVLLWLLMEKERCRMEGGSFRNLTCVEKEGS